MPELRRMTALIQREGDGFVSLCPELDIASQGDTVELFLETAAPQEIEDRLRAETYVTSLEVTVG